MSFNRLATAMRFVIRVQLFASLTLLLMLVAPRANAQAQPADSKPAETKPAEPKPGERKPYPGSYRTFFLASVTTQNDLNDIQTALRNLLPNAKIYGVASKNAISLWASPDDFLLTEKVLADIDRSRKTYRLTYSIAETDNGKSIGTQHYSLIAVSGNKTTFKQGSRTPIVTGAIDSATSKANTQVQYVDLGLNIEATVDGEGLHSKIEQSSLSEERSGLGAQDPIVRQTVLDGTSILTPGKPIVLGSLDIAGTTHHKEIEVVAELVQ